MKHSPSVLSPGPSALARAIPRRRGRRAHIIATIGPASRDPGTLKALMSAGLDLARLNFSHGTLPEHIQVIRDIRRAASELGRPCPILADLPGPKLRIGKLQGDALELKKGARLRLVSRPVTGSARLISVSYPQLIRNLKPGGLVFLNDGFIQLKALAKKGQAVDCEVLVGGSLRSFKGFALPGVRLPLRPPTDLDLQLFEFGMDQGIDLFGVSFVSSAADLEAFRRHAGRLASKVMLVGKIERAEALEKMESIMRAAEGVMVARGDLGVQIPLEQVPLRQKEITRLGNRLKRYTICATQVLQSMTDNPRPTRAEVSDAVNAVLDGSEAVMLSDETAVGKYPVESVAELDRLIRAAEGFKAGRRFSNREGR